MSVSDSSIPRYEGGALGIKSEAKINSINNN